MAVHSERHKAAALGKRPRIRYEAFGLASSTTHATYEVQSRRYPYKAFPSKNQEAFH